MKGLSARLLVAFTAAALLPAALLGWRAWRAENIAVERYGRDALERGDRELEARRASDAAIVRDLCVEDLLIDESMRALAEGETQTPRRLSRQLPARRRGMRFDLLAIVDLREGEGRGRLLASDGATWVLDDLAENFADTMENAGEEPIRLVGGSEEDLHGVELAHCITERDQVRLGVVGGHVSHGRPYGSEFLSVPAVHVRGWRRRIGGTLALGFGLALFLAILVGRRLARPLLEIETAARRVAGGDLGAAVDDTHPGAARSTMTAFNEMTEELGRAQRRLRRAERVAAWRDIARRIAHEIKNPLSPIQVSIETLRKTYAKKHPDFDEIFEESTLTILEEVDRLKRIVTEFSDFARLPRPKPAPTDLGDVIEHVTSLHRGGDVDLEVSLDEGATEIRADREQITQVLLNLVQNGCDAARARHGSRGGRLSVRLEERADGAELRVIDNGPGIPEDQRLAIFEPYHTTKSEGTGLGLAITLRIVEDHGGKIEVDEGEDGGAEFRLWLPRQGPPALPETTMTESPLVRRD